MTEDGVLFRSFQEILNKITPQTFQVLSEKALWLDINTGKRLTWCIEKILENVSFLASCFIKMVAILFTGTVAA